MCEQKVHPLGHPRSQTTDDLLFELKASSEYITEEYLKYISNSNNSYAGYGTVFRSDINARGPVNLKLFPSLRHKPLIFSDNVSIENITLKLNQILEKMILENPKEWIWSHNRWK